MVQVGIFVFGLVKDAIIEVGLASEIRNPLTWTVVVVHDRKDFLITGLKHCVRHGTILAEKLALADETRRFRQLRVSRP
jgi:hypothetical protein